MVIVKLIYTQEPY